MRSVMAECVLRARSAESLGSAAGALTAESCGIAALEDSPPHPEAIACLARLGIEACDTGAREATGEMMERADLALTMTRQQCYVLAGRFPEQGTKCYSLVEVNGAFEMLLERHGISPDGRDWRDVAATLSAGELEDALDRVVRELKSIPREQVRQIPGVDMDVRQLMTLFGPCFYQASGIHDPLHGTDEDIDRCARLVDAEVTSLVAGLLALALRD